MSFKCYQTTEHCAAVYIITRPDFTTPDCYHGGNLSSLDTGENSRKKGFGK